MSTIYFFFSFLQTCLLNSLPWKHCSHYIFILRVIVCIIGRCCHNIVAIHFSFGKVARIILQKKINKYIHDDVFFDASVGSKGRRPKPVDNGYPAFVVVFCNVIDVGWWWWCLAHGIVELLIQSNRRALDITIHATNICSQGGVCVSLRVAFATSSWGFKNHKYDTNIGSTFWSWFFFFL